MRLIFILFAQCLLSNILIAQTDFTWWNNKHNWDGVTSWTRYLKYSPGYFGPNALPVPDMEKGSLCRDTYIKLSTDFHFSKGDNTEALFFKFYYPVVKDKIAVESWCVPIEHYQMDTITRDLRFVRDKDAKGFASGDIYIATLIQLLNKKQYPELLLRIALRTASGNKQAAARFTDAPGYFFDLSVAKFLFKDTLKDISLKTYSMLGFYCWQTNLDNNPQNDALLYGVGGELSRGNISIDLSASGYKGYLGDKDAPLICKFIITLSKKKFNYSFTFQKGIFSLKYNTFSFATVFKIC